MGLTTNFIIVGDKKNEKYQQREEISPEKIASLLL
jgi:hypothetical protein